MTAGRAYTVGERGPELFVPTGSGRIEPVAAASPREVRVAITVNAAAGAAPTGEVELKAGATVLGSGELVDGEVTIPTGAFTTVGTKTLTATYAGDATTKPSSGTVVITVEPKSGGTGNPPGGNPPGGNPPAAVSARSVGSQARLIAPTTCA